MLIEVSALIISWLGVFVGHSLSRIAKEEVKYGEKNLKFLGAALSLAIYLIFFFSVDLPLIHYIVVALIVIFLDCILKEEYAAFGLMFGLMPDFLMSSIIFIHGFSTGSLMHKDNYKKIVKKTWLYLVLGLAALIARNYLLT
jgi:hypothetical protein